MKKGILILISGGICLSVAAQGTLNFANAGPGLRAQVTDWSSGVGLAGSAWSADLFWAPGVVTDSTLLTELYEPATFSTAPSQAGYFFGGARTVPTAPGVITAQVRVWNTEAASSWWAAAASINGRFGESILFQVTLANPNAVPPEIPTSMSGLNGHPWQVAILIPEPTALTFAGLGVAVLLIFRKAKRTVSRKEEVNR